MVNVAKKTEKKIAIDNNIFIYDVYLLLYMDKIIYCVYSCVSAVKRRNIITIFRGCLVYSLVIYFKTFYHY